MFKIPFEILFTSILVPLIAFFLGLLVSWIRQRRKETQDGKSTEQYFLTWGDLIARNVKRQSDGIKEFATSMTDMDDNTQYKTINLHIDKIKEVAAVDLYKALVLLKAGNKKNQNELYRKTLNSLDFFQRKSSECLDILKKFNEELRDFKETWQLGLREINTLRIEFITATERKLIPESFVFGLYHIHEAMKEKPETRKTLFDYYINPIDKLCNEFLNRTPKDEQVKKILQINSKLLLSYTIIQNRRKMYSEIFIERNKQLENSLKEFNESCSLIEKAKFRMI